MAALGVLLMTSLSAQAAPPPDGALNPSDIVWNQASNGLSVSIEAVYDLNYAYGSRLGVTLCLYQLSNLTKFNELASSFEGIAQLLSGKPEVLAGAALMSKVVFVQPEEKISLSFDRMEGARYFAVVAGYAHQDPSRCAAYLPFPAVSTLVKQRGKRVRYYTAGTLAARVSLSSEAVTVTGGETVQ